MKNHNQYNGGIADVWYSGIRADMWIEYKFVVVPKRDTTLIDLTAGKHPALSHLQQDWLKRRHAEGRHVGVLVGAKEGGVWFPGVTWSTAQSALQFRLAMRARAQLADTISRFVT